MPQEKPRVRAIAYKVPIKAITEGEYTREEEEFSPNFIQIGNLKVARVNVIGVVVSVIDSGNLGIDIEDNTGEISVRSFEHIPPQEGLVVGDFVNVIGRPREFNGEKYIAPEIIKKTDQKWMIYRKLELKDFVLPENKREEKINEKIEEEGVLSNQEVILEFIRKNDNGDGVEIGEVINRFKHLDCEKIIEGMLKEGELFENVPGKLKLLE